MAYVPNPPTVSPTIEPDQSRNNLQLAINHLHELREEIGGLPVKEIDGSRSLSEIWQRLKRINLEELCDDEIPF